MVDRTQAPELQVPDAIALKAPYKRTLKNGVPLFFIPTPGLEAIRCDVSMPIYFPHFDKTNALVPFFTINMLLEGIEGKSSAELDNFFDFYASEVDVLGGGEQHGLSLLSTKKQFIHVLPVFRALFTEATLPSKELKKRKSQKKLGISLQREQVSGRANQLIRKVLFGDHHPLGYIAEESEVDGISAEQIRAYYKEYFRILPEVFVTGDLDDSEMQAIEHAFEDLPFAKWQSKFDLNGYGTENRLIEARPNAMQESIRLATLTIPKSHPDYLPLWVFNITLGGYFGSRLVKNIREDKGYTYGIHSFLSGLTHSDYWMVTADVKKGFASEVLKECYREIGALSANPLQGEELEIVRNYMTGHFLSEFSSAFDLIGKYKKVHHQGLDFDFYNNQLQYIKNFDPEEVSYIGGKYLKEEKIKEVIVGS